MNSRGKAIKDAPMHQFTFYSNFSLKIRNFFVRNKMTYFEKHCLIVAEHCIIYHWIKKYIFYALFLKKVEMV